MLLLFFFQMYPHFGKNIISMEIMIKILRGWGNHLYFFQNMRDNPIKFYSAGGNCLLWGETLAFPWGQLLAVWFVCLCLPGIVSGKACTPHLRHVPARRWKVSISEEWWKTIVLFPQHTPSQN